MPTKIDEKKHSLLFWLAKRMDTVHENFKMAMYGYVSGTMDVAGVVIALEKMALDYENAAKEVREKISNGTL